MVGALLLALFVLPAFAHFAMRERPGRARGLGALLRFVHLRDWALIVLGAVLAAWHLPAGLFVIALGAVRLAKPQLEARAARWVDRVEIVVGVIVVTLVLADAWMPLGPGRGLLLNTVVVAALVVGVLGTFLLFERAYPTLLAWCLRHKLAFLSLPALIVLFGVTAWLGFDRVFGWLPEGTRESRPVARLAGDLPMLEAICRSAFGLMAERGDHIAGDLTSISLQAAKIRTEYGHGMKLMEYAREVSSLEVKTAA